MVRYTRVIARENLNLYSWIVGFGASIGLIRLGIQFNSKHQLKWLLLGLGVLTGSLLGAHLASVLTHWNYYSTRTSEIFEFWLGGLWWPGAVAGGLVTAALGCIWVSQNLWKVWDKISVLLLPLAASAWLASWSAGLAYGQHLDPSIWWSIRTPDETGILASRVPVQLAASATLVLLLGFIELFAKSEQKSGRRVSIVLLSFSLHNLVFSLMRVDPSTYWLGFRLDVWASITLVLFSLILILLSKRYHDKTNIESKFLPEGD
jgi:prolipoprotein diacylglyceryltransferase